MALQIFYQKCFKQGTSITLILQKAKYNSSRFIRLLHAMQVFFVDKG